jgi:hypothetical protein
MVLFYNFISTNISQLCCLEIKKVNSIILFVMDTKGASHRNICSRNRYIMDLIGASHHNKFRYGQLR